MTDVKVIPAKRNMSKPTYAEIPGPISASDAHDEPPASRAFAMPQETLPEPPKAPEPRLYASKVYTIHAISPQGFPVDFSFSDIGIELFGKKIAELSTFGYTAPAVDWRRLPDGTPICPKHDKPMRPREKQGDACHSHNVGTAENPVWCKGYRGSDSPGYEVE